MLQLLIVFVQNCPWFMIPRRWILTMFHHVTMISEFQLLDNVITNYFEIFWRQINWDWDIFCIASSLVYSFLKKTKPEKKCVFVKWQILKRITCYTKITRRLQTLNCYCNCASRICEVLRTENVSLSLNDNSLVRNYWILSLLPKLHWRLFVITWHLN